MKSAPGESNFGLGCGNPTALASLREGETVLDLGSGAGFDCFLAAGQVGHGGKVIGVDMTPEMIQKARENARKGNHENVEFRLGEIEHLPAANDSVDIVISNCVINLSPAKDKVFAEAYRVLKPGGRAMISDIVLSGDLPEAVAGSLAAYAGCIAGRSGRRNTSASWKQRGSRTSMSSRRADLKSRKPRLTRMPGALLGISTFPRKQSGRQPIRS